MTDEMKIEKAELAYFTLCDSLDEDGWKYIKKDGDLSVKYRETGDDLPMDCLFGIDIKRQVVRFLSTLPVNMLANNKLVDAAVACCIVNSKISYGCFDLNIETGAVCFRMTYSFKESVMGKDFFRNMRRFATTVIDKYNERFLALSNGECKATDFLDI
ncbi:MAG: hypothetical protein IJX96_05150 [Clostridia bacterium]|nr:hypothetical protein [Clostridia bacterium]